MCATCLKESGSGLEIMALSILPLVFFFLTRKWFALDKGKDFWEAVFFSVPETLFTFLRNFLAEDLSE